MRMKYLLQRKADDHAATRADRAAVIKRDIVKITQALEQVQHQITGVQHKKFTCAAAPIRSADTPEEGYNCKQNAAAIGVEHSNSTSARSTCRQDESPRQSATNTTSSGTTSRCSSMAREQQEMGVAKKNVCSAQPVRKVELRLPE